MPVVKILVPVFERGLLKHKPGELVELSHADAGKHVRRGWSTLHSQAAPKPVADGPDNDDPAEDKADDKGRTPKKAGKK